MRRLFVLRANTKKPVRVLSLHVAVLLSSAVVLAACSTDDSEPSLQQESDIQGGATDTNAAHSYAVGVTNLLGGVCSGTLIAPNLVLTARHCVVPPSTNATVTCTQLFPENVAPSAMSITTEPNLYKAKSSYGATEIITPGDKAFCGNDIALIILARSVPAKEAQPAIPVVQFKLTDKRLSGTISAVGYGITSPSVEDSGQRRVRENIPLLCIPGSSVMDCSGDLSKYTSDPGEFVTQGYVCSGDSGSGAFDQKTFTRGQPYVLGALSRGPQSQDKCLAAIYSRTDVHAQLIVDAAMKAADQGKYAPPTLDGPRGALGRGRSARRRDQRRRRPRRCSDRRNEDDDGHVGLLGLGARPRYGRWLYCARGSRARRSIRRAPPPLLVVARRQRSNHRDLPAGSAEQDSPSASRYRWLRHADPLQRSPSTSARALRPDHIGAGP